MTFRFHELQTAPRPKTNPRPLIFKLAPVPTGLVITTDPIK